MAPRQSIDIPFQRTVCTEADLLPVSKFSKYQAHLVASNEFFIVYTTSKRGVVRVIKQEDGSHWALDTHYSINFLHLWESGTTSSLLAVGSNDGHITIWELPYPEKSVSKDYQLKNTLSLDIDLTASRLICKSIANSRYMTFSLTNSIYVYKIPEDATDATSGSAVVEFDDNVYDFAIDAANIAVVTTVNKVSSLFLIKYSLMDLLTRKFTHSRDFKLSRFRLRSRANVWLVPQQEGMATGVSILVRDNKKLLIGNEKLQFNAELDLSKHIDNLESYSAQYDSTSETLFFNSAANPQKSYLVSLKQYQASVNLSLLTNVEFPASFEPLEFSVTKSFSAQTQGKKIVDLYIFHTKGLSILPVSIVKAKRTNKVPDEPASDLDKAVQKCLDDYRASKKLPRNMNPEVFQAVENVIAHSGIINVIVDHVEKQLEAAFDKKLAALFDQKVDGAFDERFTQLAIDAVGSALEQRQSKNSSEKFQASGSSGSTASSELEESNEASESSPSENFLEESFSDQEDAVISVSSSEPAESQLAHTSTFTFLSDPVHEPTEDSIHDAVDDNEQSRDPVRDLFNGHDQEPAYGPSPDLIYEPAREPNELGHIPKDTQARVKELWNDPPHPAGFGAANDNDAQLKREGYRRQLLEDLNDLERELLDIVESWDLGYAVRFASAHVAETSLTKVLTVFERTDEEHLRLTEGGKESRLREQLRTGDPLILLSFIAVLSADLNKPNFEYPDLNFCLMWMKTFIKVINDNRDRYQTSMPLVVQVYGKTREILRYMNFYSGLTAGVIALLNEIIG
ncbi:hypothetical protein D0Z00_000682 [Geotrichum galactomycetum]|uniref:Uncharacterized protein n=1 Tax=Geotrichum galactomycetum TaxID=27317 RepID=A0ACB6V969_9ASCO|nr:hypothetical protein D0Z00_000682 [Geotrichum candidum]